MTPSYRHYLIDNPDALSEITGITKAKEAVDILLEADLSVPEVVGRIARSLLAEELIEYLIEGHKSKPSYLSLLRDLTSIPETSWEEHGLESLYNGLLDEYAVQVLRRYIVRHDYRRCWDEIKKLRKEHHDESGWSKRLGDLVRELFLAMSAKRLVIYPTANDYMSRDNEVSGTVYDTKPRARDGRPGTQQRNFERPGWTLACDLTPNAEWNMQQHGMTDLTIEAAMALKIAWYLHQKRLEGRRQKHEAAIKKYDSAHSK